MYDRDELYSEAGLNIMNNMLNGRSDGITVCVVNGELMITLRYSTWR